MAEKPKTGPREVSDAPDKKETKHSEERLQSKKESDQRRGQTRLTIGVVFPRWKVLKEENRLKADPDVGLLLLDRLVFVTVAISLYFCNVISMHQQRSYNYSHCQKGETKVPHSSFNKTTANFE